MKKNRLLLQILSIIIPIAVYYVKPPTNYFFVLLLLQGFACIYYGLHLIQRGQIEEQGNTFISEMFAQNVKTSNKVNLKRLGFLIILAGLLQMPVYYVASDSIK